MLATALEAETSAHLGYDKHHPAGRDNADSRNGIRTRTVLIEIGPVGIVVPCTRSPTRRFRLERWLPGRVHGGGGGVGPAPSLAGPRSRGLVSRATPPRSC
ncbi:transposase [Frankia sp. R82]|uniref:transposase n=1 Tax=Frankia sp. R82 TaxID=2950553 RepID=UPI0020445D10|nr:transposase [Frankia sp. R82]MCM3886761.1 transposase [Frankia sp. R82]